jgi:hypothetical protein
MDVRVVDFSHAEKNGEAYTNLEIWYWNNCIVHIVYHYYVSTLGMVWKFSTWLTQNFNFYHLCEYIYFKHVHILQAYVQFRTKQKFVVMKVQCQPEFIRRLKISVWCI